MTISKKLLGSVIAILAVTFAVLGWIVDARARDALVAQASQSLEAVRLARGRLLEHDLQQTSGTVKLVADTIFLRQAFPQMQAAVEEPGTLDALQTVIDQSVQGWMSVFRWAGVVLILPDGRVGYSSGTTVGAGVDVRRGPLASTALGLAHARAMAAPFEQVSVLDFSEPQPVTGPPNVFLSAPAFDATRRQRIGVLVVRVAASLVDDIINNATGLGDSGETYLVGADGLMRSTSRLAGEPTIMRRQVNTEAVRRAFAGESGTIQQLDYRGVPVIASFALIDLEGVRWAIIAERDLAEVLVPARALSQRIALLFGVFSIAAVALLVVALRTVVLRPIAELLAGARRVQTGDFKSAIEVKKADELGQLADTMNGMMQSIDASMTALRDAQRDLEQRYQELRELQTLRDNLTYMIIHDLRAPLTSVMGYLQLVLTKPDSLTAEAASYVGESFAGGQRMAALVNTLLDVTRLEAGELPIDRQHRDLVETAADARQSLGGLLVDRTVDSVADGPVHMPHDYELMRRVIANLLDNALKFTPPSARIVIAVAMPSPKIARVEVRDDGPGIADADLPRVFEKFGRGAAGKSLKRHSSGLGLAFCKLAVEAHGGAIGVISTPGQGTTFWFELTDA